MMGILNAIGDFFNTVWMIVNLIINLLITFFYVLFKAMETLFLIAQAFPILSLGLIAIIVICIVYKILGREASS